MSGKLAPLPRTTNVTDAPIDVVDLIHGRLMGISKTTMLHIAQHGHFADFPTVEQIKKNQSKSICVSCVLSKLQPRQLHAPAHRKATAPLEFLYMDTHGPITPQDLAGNMYFHIIVDSFSDENKGRNQRSFTSMGKGCRSAHVQTVWQALQSWHIPHR